MFIGDFFRWISGTKRCNTLAKLVEYMRGKSFEELAHWISQRMTYKTDAGIKEQWETVDAVLARDKNGKMEVDCEEKACTAAAVIEKLGWGAVKILFIRNADITKGHAVCITWTDKEIVINDNAIVARYPFINSVSEIVRARWPEAIAWGYISKRGKIEGDMVLLK